MHGNPLYRILLVVAAFSGVGLLTLQQTRPGVPLPVPASGAPSSRREPERLVTLHLSARVLPVPERLEVKSFGQTVLEGGGRSGRFESDWTTTVPAGGMDLVVEGRWSSPSSLSATELTVTFPDGRTVSKTFWSDGSGAEGLRDVLTISGEALSPDGSG